MNIIFITGNHPRHKYIARRIAETGHLSTVISEVRENHVPAPPTGLSEHAESLFSMHFQKRQEAESKFFEDKDWPDCRVVEITREQLNGPIVKSILSENPVDLLLSYGCHRLDDPTLDLVVGERWNIHGGLSPWYRGAITHFWPSYFLEPQMTGMTIHELTKELDAGAVVHQAAADLVRGDGVHDLACRAVLKVGEELPTVISLLRGSSVPLIKKHHSTSGKLWLVNDWRPEHLQLIYETYGDKVVDQYLDGAFQNREPKLFRQF
ncbi:formyltransferase family protein [Arenicella xantha]|uniref:Formyl transferase-like protein n=1 Tax=Arenicella xantha TaxID=644221 RepID=A0A395JPA5_9GAMM|nr:formyltransferase family protein [Arenicella xantha]RBP49894.1 formyl transferase-like protein [Arenicella xantha]